jgi:hypothetical protein
MTVVDRADVRTAFYQLLAANVTGAQAVVDGFTEDLGGMSPVVVVASAGMDRARLTLRGSQPKVALDVYVFALATAGADDLLDAAEQQVAQVVEDNQAAARWSAIDYAGDTEVGFIVALDGAEYRRERIPLRFTAR